jgi:hypothetical protein
MARNDEVEILAREREASHLGYIVVEKTIFAREFELSNQFRWIANQLPQMISKKTSAERKRPRQEISKRIKELSDVVRAKHIQHNLPFRCIDDYDECVARRRRQKRSTYLCSLALFICLANSIKALLIAMAAAGGAGGLLR